MDKRQLEEGLELALQFEKRGGLLPVIVQDYQTGEVQMLAYANEKALDRTLDTGYATFWSTSSNKLWTKGDVSGNLLKIKEVLIDCDQDALIYMVKRLGSGVCHTGRRTCFYRRLAGSGLEFLGGLK